MGSSAGAWGRADTAITAAYSAPRLMGLLDAGIRPALAHLLGREVIVRERRRREVLLAPAWQAVCLGTPPSLCCSRANWLLAALCKLLPHCSSDLVSMLFSGPPGADLGALLGLNPLSPLDLATSPPAANSHRNYLCFFGISSPSSCQDRKGNVISPRQNIRKYFASAGL